MTTQEFASIKSKIESAKEKKNRAEGAKAKIEENWARDFDINNLEEAESKVAELEKEIASDKAKLEKQYLQLEKITSWDEI
jgi:DNA repair exonuclease SbcCD ATPase subunit